MSLISSANILPILLIDLYRENLFNGTKIVPTPGVVGALLSPENRGIGEALAGVERDGQITSIRYSYKQPFEASDFEEEPTCGETGAYNPWLEEQFGVDSYIEHTFSISEYRLRTYPRFWSEIRPLLDGTGTQGPEAVQFTRAFGNAIQRGTITRQLEGLGEISLDLMNEVRAFVDKLNSMLVPMLAAGAGAWKGGSIAAENTYNVQYPGSFASGGGSINAGEVWKFDQDVREQQIPGGKWSVIHGFGAYDRIASRNPNQFGDSQQGVNFSNIELLGDKYRGYIDANIAANLGDVNDAIVMAPGSALLAQSPQYMMFGNIGIVERLTIPIPGFPGLTADLTITPVACGYNGQGEYQVKISKRFGMWTAPLDLFRDDSPFVGVNGIFLANFAQA